MKLTPTAKARRHWSGSMHPLTKKLIRDLWRMRGQVLAVALVIASGVATLIMALTTIEALDATADAYYQRYRFADVFAHAKRAPQHLRQRISAIPGVQTVSTRISFHATLDITGFEEPVVGKLVSVPDDSQPKLNQLVVRKGRWMTPDHPNEVLVSESFAEAHQLGVGDSLSAILNGRKRKLTIVGLALSPEFIYAISPGGLLPDDKRFGVIWASDELLAAAYDLKEAFNDVVLSLRRDAQPKQVLQELDNLLAPYGGTSAILRKDQISNWFVMNEIAQQRTMANILPTIFLAVSMFLMYMVLTRLISVQRTEIGLLKAFGYSNLQVGWHFISMVLLICLLGIALGALLGSYLGRVNTEMYATLFRFPLLVFQPSAQSFTISASISLALAVLGALNAVRSAVKLPPAEAMIPPSPPVYHTSALTDSNWLSWLDQPTRIALRQLTRWPLRTALGSCGIAMSVGLIIMNLQWQDSLGHLSRTFFFDAQRQDVTLGMHEITAMRSLYDMQALPGVIRAEPTRYASVDFFAGSLTHRGTITAIESDSELQPVYDDSQYSARVLPPKGLLIARRLAQKLKVKEGDVLTLAFQEGRRPEVDVPVVGVFETYIGMPAFMALPELNRILGDGPSFNYAHLLVDEREQSTLFATLKDTPAVGSITLRESALNAFEETLIEHLMVSITIFSALAMMLAFGVTYNSTRIALSERGRELATLRVLGFSRGETAYVLLGEVMFVVVFAIPIGCIAGYLLVLSMASAFDTEMFRIPLVIEPSTFAYAIVLMLTGACLSAWWVRRSILHLDLIRVLKTRE